MRLIERIGSKSLHVGKYLCRDVRRNAVIDAADNFAAVGIADAAVYEFLLLRHQRLFILLAHRPSDEVCLAEREACKKLEDLHDLFLVDGNAVGDLKYLLLFGTVVGYGLFAVLPLAETVYELHGTGTIERYARYQVFESIGLERLHEPLHAALFKLKHAVGVTVGNESVRARIGISYLGEIDYKSRILFYIVDALFDIGQSDQRKEVHLEHSQRLYFLCHELRRYVLAVARQGYVVCNLFAAYDDACRVHARLSGHTLELESHVYYSLKRLVGLVYLAELGISRTLELVEFAPDFLLLVGVAFGVHLLFGRLYSSAQKVAYRRLSVHYLCKSVGFRIGNAHDSADVLYGVLCRHCAESDYLTDVFGMVFLSYVLNCLLAPVRAEVDIEVRHGYSVGI